MANSLLVGKIEPDRHTHTHNYCNRAAHARRGLMINGDTKDRYTYVQIGKICNLVTIILKGSHFLDVKNSSVDNEGAQSKIVLNWTQKLFSFVQLALWTIASKQALVLLRVGITCQT